MLSIRKKFVILIGLATLTWFDKSIASNIEDSGYSYGGFVFSRDLPPERIKLVKNDIKFLATLPPMRDVNNFQAMAGLSALDGAHLHNWLVNRVRYFISEDADFDILFGLTGQSYKYQNEDASPISTRGASNRSEESKVVATNIGGGLYLYGREKKTLVTATINGKTQPVLSPRVGVIQLSDFYFDEEASAHGNPQSILNRLSRLSTLLHEARHSDGNGFSVGFVHKVCPKGHPYAGEKACDQYENGAYGLEARFNQVLSKNCKSCSAGEIEVLRLAALDGYTRLISPPAIQTKVVRLQRVLETYQFILNICKSTKEDPACTPTKVKQNTQKYAETRNQIETLVKNGEGVSSTRVIGDPKPEGFFQEQTVGQTKALINSTSGLVPNKGQF